MSLHRMWQKSTLCPCRNKLQHLIRLYLDLDVLRRNTEGIMVCIGHHWQTGRIQEWPQNKKQKERMMWWKNPVVASPQNGPEDMIRGQLSANKTLFYRNNWHHPRSFSSKLFPRWAHSTLKPWLRGRRDTGCKHKNLFRFVGDNC